MWLADTSVKRPVFATMAIMGLVVLGVVSYPKIGVDLFPKVDFPIVTVSTHLNGASPEVIDVDVTDRIEGAVNTINGVKSITSSSTSGDSRVTIEFVLDRNIDLAAQDVREKVALIRNKLPADIEEPRIAKVDPDATAVLWMNLSGQKSVKELSTYVDEVLKEQLQRINGVGDVQLWGLRLRQIRVWLDADKLRAYGGRGDGCDDCPDAAERRAAGRPDREPLEGIHGDGQGGIRQYFRDQRHGGRLRQGRSRSS